MSRGPVVVLTRAPCSAPFRSELPTPTERNADLRTRRRWQVVRDFRDFVTKFVESGEAASWAVDLGRVRANEGPSELGDGNWQGSDLLPLCRGRKSGPLNPKPGFCCLFWARILRVEQQIHVSPSETCSRTSLAFQTYGFEPAEWSIGGHRRRIKESPKRRSWRFCRWYPFGCTHGRGIMECYTASCCQTVIACLSDSCLRQPTSNSCERFGSSRRRAALLFCKTTGTLLAHSMYYLPCSLC